METLLEVQIKASCLRGNIQSCIDTNSVSKPFSSRWCVKGFHGVVMHNLEFGWKAQRALSARILEPLPYCVEGLALR